MRQNWTFYICCSKTLQHICSSARLPKKGRDFNYDQNLFNYIDFKIKF